MLKDSPTNTNYPVNVRTLTASCLLSVSLKPITAKQACVKRTNLTAGKALLEWEHRGFMDGEKI